MSDDDFTFAELETTEDATAGATGGGHGGRVLRPAPGDGVLLDDRSFQLEDVTELAESLAEHARGRLQRLRRTADAVESRLRERIAESHDCIQRAFARADELVQQRIDETRRRSREILEERYRQGYELGYQEGFRRGREEGLAQGLAEGNERGQAEGREQGLGSFIDETRDASTTIVALSDQLEERWRVVHADAHRDILELALEIARDVILVEVQQVPEIIEEKLRTALDRLAAEERLTVEIHPEDLDVVHRYLEDVTGAVEGSALFDVVTRDDIGRGGCRVVGATSSVDLTLETQLDVVTRRLGQALGDPS